MNRQIFVVSIDNLFGYFQRKVPGRQTIDQWFNDVENIPDAAVADIEAGIKRNDSLPRNIPNAYRDGWAIWQRSNPDKVVRPLKTECPECRNSGFLWFCLKGYSRVCRCAMCENWRKDCSEAFLPAYTRSQLIEMGAEGIR